MQSDYSCYVLVAINCIRMNLVADRVVGVDGCCSMSYLARTTFTNPTPTLVHAKDCMEIVVHLIIGGQFMCYRVQIVKCTLHENLLNKNLQNSV